MITEYVYGVQICLNTVLINNLFGNDCFLCRFCYRCFYFTDLDYFNPTTLSIVIPTTLGLLCIFLLGCTLT